MSQNPHRSAFPTLITFLVGAALGAVVVALTTPKSSPRLRRDLKGPANRGRVRGHRVARELLRPDPQPRRTYVWYTPDAKGGHPISVNDLPG